MNASGGTRKGSISAPSAAASRRLRSETRPAGRSPHTPPSLRWAGVQTTKPVDNHRKKHHPSGWCFFSVSINPRPCHSEPVTDVTGVGIRNLLAGNLRKSAGIMRFGNGLPRQCVPQGHLLRGAHWLAMTGFFDRLETPSVRMVFSFWNAAGG